MRTSTHCILTTAGAAFLLGSLAGSLRADILYVASLNGITKFTSGGVGSYFAPTGNAEPTFIAFDTGRNLYVASASGRLIERISPSGGDFSIFSPSGSFAPYGLAFDSTGTNLYVANVNGPIEKFNLGGVRSTFAQPTLGLPVGVAFDLAGNLYVSEASPFSDGNSTIQKFSTNGVGSVFASVPLHSPFGLAFDSAGNLYAAFSSESTIEKFTPDGVGSVFADASDGLRNPTGLAFDSAGNLYAAGNSADGNILKFRPDGVGSIFATGVNNPIGLAFTTDAGVPLRLPPPSRVIPEPGTWVTGITLCLPALLGMSRPRRPAGCAHK